MPYKNALHSLSAATNVIYKYVAQYKYMAYSKTPPKNQKIVL